MSHAKRQYVLDVWVDEADYPGPDTLDVKVQTEIVAMIGNGKLPADGVTIEPLGSYLEVKGYT